jgi:hypothetical protein
MQWSHTPRAPGEDTRVVRNEAEVSMLFSEPLSQVENVEPAYRIPTGFYIHSVAFVSPSDVNVTGYVWQHYPEGFPVGYAKGVVFPEEVNANGTTMEQRYRADTKEGELIGWFFDVTVRQSFDYTAYPLDHLTIWLLLWPKDFKHDTTIALVPDFSAYLPHSGSTFGLDHDIVPGEWNIDETFFSYRDIPYDTNFGYRDKPAATSYRAFYFNIGVQRKFINAFIINLVPLFVVSFLLFSAVLTISGDKDHADRFGFNATGILATCSALFFVVLMAHIQVRSRFASAGLVYMEYFYLLMYIALLLTALNAYLFSLKTFAGCKLLHFRDNLIPKVTFWPLLLWSMAVISWVKR